MPADDPEGALWVYQPRREMLWVYDFNLAFDEKFSRDRFFEAHVFGGMLREWPEGFRMQMETQMLLVLKEVRTIFAELPLEWLHVDSDDSLPVQLDEKRVISVLELPFTDPDSFWKLP
ncbi:MAG: HipA family kinase [Verrucomicrobiota bacterium]